MALDINNKALRGSISQILLNALISGDKYGYEICKDIEQKSNGNLLLKQPSLYSSLRRMEGQGLITSYWADSDLGGRRHYYSITEKGRKHYEKKQVNWNDFGDIINALPTTNNTSSDKEIDSTLEQDNDTDTVAPVSNFGVAHQESLFSMPTKKITQTKETSSAGETFIQFDMFDQNTNFIKSTNDTSEEVFSTFKSKYSTIMGSIEPAETEINTSSKEDVMINDESIINDNDLETEITNTSEQSTDVNDFLLETKLKYSNENSNEETVDDSFDLDITEGAITSYPEEKEEKILNDAVILPPNTPVIETPNSGVIIDNSNNYKKSSNKFSSNSFAEKQKSETYTHSFGKFAYTKDSENIYGSDFSSLEQESLKGSLDSFLNTDETEDEDTSTPFKFDENDNKDIFVGDATDKEPEEKKLTIDDIIPQPKPLEEYDEVLKDHERIEPPVTDNKKQLSSEDFNTVKYVGQEDNGSFIKKQPEQIHNYKDKIANLYSDTSNINPYNKPLDEDAVVSLNSEEIFESIPQKQPIQHKIVSTTSLDELQQEFGSVGIKLKLYNKSTYTRKKQDNYINYSALSLVKGWIVWLFMVLEIGILAFILNTNQLLPVSQHTLYWWAFGLSFIYPIYYTLAFFIDPYRKVVSNFKLGVSLFNKFLAMLINIVFIFAINLFFGMTALNQLAYLSYWLLPIVLTSNYLISTLIYFILLKGKKFSI